MKEAINSTSAGKQQGSFRWNVQYLCESKKETVVNNTMPIREMKNVRKFTDAETLNFVRSELT